MRVGVATRETAHETKFTVTIQLNDAEAAELLGRFNPDSRKVREADLLERIFLALKAAR